MCGEIDKLKKHESWHWFYIRETKITWAELGRIKKDYLNFKTKHFTQFLISKYLL